MSGFDAKRVWITGASSGIGEALARSFNKAGAQVIISARRTAELERVKAASTRPENVAILPLDLEKNDQAEAWTAEAWQQFDGIDILINNGGIGQYGSVVDTKMAVERKLFEVNFFGAVALSKAILPKFLERGRGKLMAIASIAGKFGQRNLAGYSASKSALILYYESLKEEMAGKPVQVQVVSPGFINTQVTINSLNAEGKPLQKNSPAQENGMPAEVFARKFLKVAQGKKFHSYIGNKELLAVPLHTLWPGLFYKLLGRG